MKICVFRYIRFASKSCGFEGRYVLILPCPCKTTDKARSGARIAGAGFFAVCFLLYPRCSRLARSRAGPAPEMPAAFIADHIVQPLDHVPRHILRQRRPDGRPILKNDPVTADSRRLAAILGCILRRVQREVQKRHGHIGKRVPIKPICTNFIPPKRKAPPARAPAMDAFGIKAAAR